MKQSIAFRVDSGASIGTGHVMRCLTIAASLRERGVDSLFICRARDSSIEARIAKAGFQVTLLPQASGKIDSKAELMHGDFLECTQDEDAEATLLALVAFPNLKAMIVDHYGIYKPWDNIIESKFKIFKIDDIADRKHLCAGLLDQNYYLGMEYRYKDLVLTDCMQLLGPSYALLRPQFKNLDVRHRSVRPLANALICFGGADPKGHSLGVAKCLLENTGLQVKVLGSPNAMHKERWADLLKRFPKRLEEPCFKENPIIDMLEADIYIGAGGTITWERFACGLPGIVYSIAENQIRMSEDLDRAKFQIYGGKIDDFSAEKLLEHISKMQDPDLRWQQSQAMRSLVDGNGVDRVINDWGLV